MSSRIRVMVYGRLNRLEDSSAFEAAFAQVSASVKGTPGHIKDELLRDSSEPGSYILMAEWNSRDEFLSWEQTPIHMQKTLPMRPYWKGTGERKIFEVGVAL
ncbi:MAG TPA: antibiotic biosynthesis monooxygenase family protein [Ktedonosporobacter sp.]|nr:antibiotic biosynthesis monooxygenase family protein [Ktedonosporobacter sp.]